MSFLFSGHLRPDDHHDAELHQIYDPVKIIHRDAEQIDQGNKPSYKDQPEDQAEKCRHDPFQLLLVNTVRYIPVDKYQQGIGKDQGKDGDVGDGIQKDILLPHRSPVDPDQVPHQKQHEDIQDHRAFRYHRRDGIGLYRLEISFFAAKKLF